MCGLRSFFDIETQICILQSAICNALGFTEYAGGHRSRVTPVPIPNTEVKPATADGTARETAWESRSLPAVIVGKSPSSVDDGLFLRPLPLVSGAAPPRAAPRLPLELS